MKTFNKKLYKSRNNRVIFGVMGGLGEYFDIDPVLCRVVYIVISTFTALAPGILAYIIMALVMPEKPLILHEESHS
jgi:phage shock protein C